MIEWRSSLTYRCKNLGKWVRSYQEQIFRAYLAPEVITILHCGYTSCGRSNLRDIWMELFRAYDYNHTTPQS